MSELQTERAWPAMRQKASEVHLPESAVLNLPNQAILQLLRRDMLFLFHRARKRFIQTSEARLTMQTDLIPNMLAHPPPSLLFS